MMRLFVALDLPKEIKKTLHGLRDDDLPGARWTKPEQWHITLHFIGECESDAPIQNALKSVQAESFEIRLRGVGTFPPKGKPRVLWAGIEASDALQKLYSAVGAALQKTGFTPDTRPYRPHLTVARFKHKSPGKRVMDAYELRHADYETQPFSIQHITLYESDLQQSGAVYTIRAQVSI